MTVAPNAYKYIGDANIVKVDTDQLIRVWAHEDFPFLAALQQGKAGASETTHYWMNSPEGLLKTALNMPPPGGMPGGTPSASITVDSTDGIIPNHVVEFQENGANAAQEAFVVSIANATTMTVQAFVGNLSAHADNTVITVVGDRTQYGTTLDHQLRLPTRDSNTIEQVSVAATLPYNMTESELLNGQSVEEWLTIEAISLFKQKLTMRVLFGGERTAAANTGYAGMSGFVNMIPAANIVSAGFTRAAFRSFISSIKQRGGFTGNQGLLVCNDRALVDMTGFDDGNVGISWKETDKYIGEVQFLGITFTVVVDQAMNEHYRTDRARVIAFSKKHKGQNLLRLAIKAGDKATGQIRKVLEEESQYRMKIVRFCCGELRDDYRHGIFRGT